MKRDRGIATWGIPLALALAGLLAPAHAQQTEKVARVGFLSLADGPGAAQFGVAKALQGLGSVRYAVDFGCLLSYGPSLDEFSAIIARQIDKVLKGAKVADLPVEQVTRFELLVNMKTAKTLGITVSRSVLVRADEVIE